MCGRRDQSAYLCILLSPFTREPRCVDFIQLDDLLPPPNLAGAQAKHNKQSLSKKVSTPLPRLCPSTTCPLPTKAAGSLQRSLEQPPPLLLRRNCTPCNSNWDQLLHITPRLAWWLYTFIDCWMTLGEEVLSRTLRLSGPAMWGNTEEGMCIYFITLFGGLGWRQSWSPGLTATNPSWKVLTVTQSTTALPTAFPWLLRDFCPAYAHTVLLFSRF